MDDEKIAAYMDWLRQEGQYSFAHRKPSRPSSIGNEGKLENTQMFDAMIAELSWRQKASTREKLPPISSYPDRVRSQKKQRNETSSRHTKDYSYKRKHSSKSAGRHSKKFFKSIKRKKSVKVHPDSYSQYDYRQLLKGIIRNRGIKCFYVIFIIFVILFVVSLVGSVALSYYVASLKADVNKLKSLVMISSNISRGVSSLEMDIISIKKNATETKVSFTEMRANFTRLEQSLAPNGIIGVYENFPAESCAVPFQSSAPSGYYWIRTATGSAARLYCDMQNTCGSQVNAGPWIKLYTLNVSESSCPSNFNLSVSSNRSICVNPNDDSSCSSALTISTNAIRYSKVCGRVFGYYFGSPDAFIPYGNRRLYETVTIDVEYVDGVSLTYGRNPRNHIWTFSVGVCPCDTGRQDFVYNDLFCQSALCREYSCENRLWDRPICSIPGGDPPYFNKDLFKMTSEDIELRICRDQPRADEDIGITFVEIYVQ